jgi:MFS transporter, PPP family, 3-phenylpropionic acid transporter
VLRWILMATTHAPAPLFLAQAMHGVTFAATHLGAVYALTRLVDETRRAQAQGWISGVNALTYAAAAIGCGFLWNRFGAGAYLAMAALAAAGTALVVCVAFDRRTDM